MSSVSEILIYGAYGYTGRLIVQLCNEKGIRPILAGRNPEAVRTLAEEHDFEWTAFSLDNPEEIQRKIKSYKVILHCAGPFIHTAKPVLEACLKTGVHYLDITGEIQVFELAASLDKVFKTSGICAIPGVGFDVVPSDCMAAHVHSQLPDATHLTLAIYSKGGVSRGTALTMIENIDKGGAVREKGRIKTVPAAWKTKTFDFGDITRDSVTIPWGDVSTAYHSTGIPNIEVFMSLPKQTQRMLTMNRYFGFLFKLGFVKSFLKKKVNSGKSGPSEDSRRSGETRILATARNEAGKTVTSRLTGPEGYTLTALTALDAAVRIAGKPLKPGFYTPSKAFGADYILSFDGVTRTDL